MEYSLLSLFGLCLLGGLFFLVRFSRKNSAVRISFNSSTIITSVLFFFSAFLFLNLVVFYSYGSAISFDLLKNFHIYSVPISFGFLLDGRSSWALFFLFSISSIFCFFSKLYINRENQNSITPKTLIALLSIATLFFSDSLFLIPFSLIFTTFSHQIFYFNRFEKIKIKLLFYLFILLDFSLLFSCFKFVQIFNSDSLSIIFNKLINESHSELYWANFHLFSYIFVFSLLIKSFIFIFESFYFLDDEKSSKWNLIPFILLPASYMGLLTTKLQFFSPIFFEDLSFFVFMNSILLVLFSLFLIFSNGIKSVFLIFPIHFLYSILAFQIGDFYSSLYLLISSALNFLLISIFLKEEGFISHGAGSKKEKLIFFILVFNVIPLPFSPIFLNILHLLRPLLDMGGILNLLSLFLIMTGVLLVTFSSTSKLLFFYQENSKNIRINSGFKNYYLLIFLIIFNVLLYLFSPVLTYNYSYSRGFWGIDLFLSNKISSDNALDSIFIVMLFSISTLEFLGIQLSYFSTFYGMFPKIRTISNVVNSGTKVFYKKLNNLYEILKIQTSTIIHFKKLAKKGQSLKLVITYNFLNFLSQPKQKMLIYFKANEILFFIVYFSILFGLVNWRLF